MSFHVLWYPIGIYNPLSPLAHAVDFQDTAEGLPRSIINHLEVGELFLQLSGVAFHTSWFPQKGSIKLSGLAAWFASWPGQLFTYASDCIQTALVWNLVELSVLGWADWTNNLRQRCWHTTLGSYHALGSLWKALGPRPFVWFSIVWRHDPEIAVYPQKNRSVDLVDPQNTSWGLPVSLTTTSSSCFPRTFRTAGGCWPLTG